MNNYVRLQTLVTLLILKKKKKQTLDITNLEKQFKIFEVLTLILLEISLSDWSKTSLLYVCYKIRKISSNKFLY